MSLIITDYCMPGMTGYDLLKRVKVRGPQIKFLPPSPHCSGSHIKITPVVWCGPLADSGMQGSSSLKDIPVVIMSSENVPARISR